MITIDTKEDIELLLAFYEQFKLTDILKAQEEVKSVELTDDAFSEVNKKLDEVLNELEQFKENYIHKSEIEKRVKEILEKSEEKEKLIRKYKSPYTMFKIRKLNSDGTFEKAGSGKGIKCTIQDGIKLKKMIPQKEKYPTFKSMEKEFPHLYSSTLIRMSYCIEKGWFEEFLNEWEQIQAEEYFEKEKQKEIIFENNPQKRKEQGMV